MPCAFFQKPRVGIETISPRTRYSVARARSSWTVASCPSEPRALGIPFPLRWHPHLGAGAAAAGVRRSSSSEVPQRGRSQERAGESPRPVDPASFRAPARGDVGTSIIGMHPPFFATTALSSSRGASPCRWRTARGRRAHPELTGGVFHTLDELPARLRCGGSQSGCHLRRQREAMASLFALRSASLA